MSADQSIDYGIGTVARLTGLTTHTIRAWEKRHGAVSAGRDSAGRRRYSPADVERLTKLKRLVDLGERIGKLAQRSVAELDARLTALEGDRSTENRSAAPLRLGCYGQGADALARRLRDVAGPEAVVDTRNDVTPAGLKAASPDIDCLLFDTGSVAPAFVADLKAVAALDAKRSVILVYGFARDEDLRGLALAGVIIVRAPASAADLSRALAEARGKIAAAAALERAGGGHAPSMQPERLTAEELTRVGSISTSIDCECPHHLATVISNLRAFERYSADCANRDDKDAAMHEYLYRETVRANQIVEHALRHLMDYEGIKI